MSDNDITQQLGDELRRRADHGSDATGTPISLDRVRGRAHGIQRRRRITGAVAVAASVAILVPTAMLAGSALDRSDEGRDPATPTETPTPQQHHRVALSPSLPEGAAPKVPWIEGTTLHVPGSTDITLNRAYGDLIRIGDRWVASTSTDGGESSPTTILAADGSVEQEFDTQSGVVVSSDRTVAAWVTMDGEITLMDEDGISPVHQITGERFIGVLGVQGSGPCTGSGSDGCSIYFSEQILPSYEDLPLQVVSNDGGRETAPGDFTGIWAVSSDGLIAGDLHEQGIDPARRACDAVYDAEAGRRLWRTCRSNLLLASFSPDADLVTSRIEDKLGSETALRVHDARTGRALLTAKLPRGNIVATTWEDDSHLLVHMVRPSGIEGPITHDLYRVSLDGKAELVMSGDTTDPMGSPWSMVP